MKDIVENKFSINEVNFLGYVTLNGIDIDNKNEKYKDSSEDSFDDELNTIIKTHSLTNQELVESELNKNKEKILNELDYDFVKEESIPNEIKVIPDPSNDNSLFNELNVRQNHFVNKCMDNRSEIIKILFGPPGTGKTYTLIELTKRIVNANPQSKILLTAPSNQAADLLCYRLSKFFNEQNSDSKFANTQMIRLNGILRGPRDLNFESAIKPYCRMTERPKAFYIPTIDELKHFNVIICTCTCAG